MATKLFSKVDAAKQVTFTGLGAMVGCSYVVQKTAGVLDVRVIMPVGVTAIAVQTPWPVNMVRTWQEFVAQFDSLI